MNLILFNSINLLFLIFLFCFFQFIFIKTQQFNKNIVCANRGRFLNAYCLADYNCNNLKILRNKYKVCIRGICCTQTKIRKEMANKRTLEDKECPKNSFNVGIKCKINKDCQIKKTINLKEPFSLLECSKQAGICCTSVKYLKPLSKGKWCLNWGKALGKECNTNNECKSAKRPKAVCVDGECCTRPREIINDKGEEKEEEDLISEKSEEKEEEENDENKRKKQDDNKNDDNDNFEDFDNLYSEEEDEEEDKYKDKTKEQSDEQEDYSENINNKKISLRRELIKGQRICRRKGLKYKNVRKCSKLLNCGNFKIFICISGHCCLKTKYFDSKEEKSKENLNKNFGRLPASPFGFCLANKNFNRFIGRLCTDRKECPKALDAYNKRVAIRCLNGACCAAMQQPKNIFKDKSENNKNKNFINKEEEDGWILPPKQKYNAFCFDGTPSKTQCISQRDCPNYNRQICENGICCSPNIDQKQYACGGLPSSGQCNHALIALSTGAGCKSNFYCVPPGVCCECRFGMPQPGINNCIKNNQCKSGYKCEKRNGFCCPRCPQGRMPFGTCYKGECAKTFFCNFGNICCKEKGKN